MNRAVLTNSVKSARGNFDDAVLASAARACCVNAIITRNAKDFVGSGLSVYTPREWLASQI